MDAYVEALIARLGASSSSRGSQVTKNLAIGSSLYDEEGSKIVPQIVEKAASKGSFICAACDCYYHLT